MYNPNEPSAVERRLIERRKDALRSIKSRQVFSQEGWSPPTVSTEEAFFCSRVIRGYVPDDSQSAVELDDSHEESQWGVRGCFYGKGLHE